MRRRVQLLLATTLALTGCSAILGVNDIFLADGTGDEGGAGEASTNETSAPDASVDTSTCSANLQTSAQHCGRCGHDCLGGLCSDGKCQALTLLNAQAAPLDFAIDGTYAYLANNGDGTIVRIEKSGTGTPKTLATGLGSDVQSVAVSGDKLFWSANDALPADGGLGGGGLFMCTLPECTGKRLVSTVGYAHHMVAHEGFVYFTADDGVRRIKVDGTAEQTLLNDSNQPYAVAVDDTHVYFSSAQSTLRRVPIGGGAGEDLAPLGDQNGFVALDATHVYWTFSKLPSAEGTAFGAPKAAPGNRVSYGAAPQNTNTVGIASDGTNVFIANDGLFASFQPTGNGNLLTCPVTGCVGNTPTVLYDGLLGTGPVILEGEAVYFLEYGGTAGANGRLLRIAKP